MAAVFTLPEFFDTLQRNRSVEPSFKNLLFLKLLRWFRFELVVLNPKLLIPTLKQLPSVEFECCEKVLCGDSWSDPPRSWIATKRAGRSKMLPELPANPETDWYLRIVETTNLTAGCFVLRATVASQTISRAQIDNQLANQSLIWSSI